MRTPRSKRICAPSAVVAQLGGEAELLVGLDGIEPFLLQLVGVNLRRQADAAAFLPHVKQHAVAGGFDLRERGVELVAAIAAQRAEDVAGEALAVHAHERRLFSARSSPFTSAR